MAEHHIDHVNKKKKKKKLFASLLALICRGIVSGMVGSSDLVAQRS